jgi:RNA polymerase sigma factor (sigma-70 family)
VAIAPPLESTDIVRAAQAGDRGAFDRLYQSYLPKIYDYVLGMLRNRVDAEDVCSETFLTAVERLGSLRDPAAFKGWLYTIARNAALRVVDGRKRAVPMDDHPEDAAAVDAAPLPEPEERAEGGELAALLDEAAATLGERERTVYELTVRHGLSSAEVADVLGVRPAYAYILVNRLKGSVGEALEAVVLARVGRGDCAGLAAAVGPSGVMSSKVRKAVARHARSCSVCAETKRRRASIPVLMQGMAWAEPGAEFAARLAGRIGEAWAARSETAGAAAASAAGAAGVVGAIVAVLVLTTALVGAAAQRTIAPRDQAGVRHAATAAQTTPVPPRPAPSAQPAPVSAGNSSGGPPPATAAPAPPSGTQVVVVDGGGDSSTQKGTSSTGSSSSSQSINQSSTPNPYSGGDGQNPYGPPG